MIKSGNDVMQLNRNENMVKGHRQMSQLQKTRVKTTLPKIFAVYLPSKIYMADETSIILLCNTRWEFDICKGTIDWVKEANGLHDSVMLCESVRG